MNEVVDRRKNKFNRFKDLRESGGAVFVKPQEYSVWDRISDIADVGSFTEFSYSFPEIDPLNFPDYQTKKDNLREFTGAEEALLSGTCRIFGYKCVIAVMNKEFMMASMGIELGERIAKAFEYAMKRRLPVIIFTASGGARMQEGIMSLMQMAKTSAVVKKFKDRGGLYISVLTHPTTGGVSASFATLGDITLAEPGALIGFAGPRVIEQTIGEKLPEGFQRAEFLQEHGFVDQVVERDRLRDTLGQLLMLHSVDQVADKAKDMLNAKPAAKSNAKPNKLTAMEKVLKARETTRPRIPDYVEGLFTEFFEQKGDALGKEDASIYGGIALYHGMPVTVIGHRKGRDVQENIECNFGMPGPEGYRKALRLMRQAEKFGRPIITFVDTPGAYPGLEAEMFGQAQAISQNLAEMSALRVPVISIVTGEGSSGGALGIAVANRVYMLENAVYSVLSPEGFASILWHDAAKKEEAASVMRLTAQDLMDLGVIEGIISEDGMEDEIVTLMTNIDVTIKKALNGLVTLSGDQLAMDRYTRFRKIDERFLAVENSAKVENI